MPIINIQMLEGRTIEQKNNLMKEITDVVVKNTGAKKENVSVIITDMKKENYCSGGNINK